MLTRVIALRQAGDVQESLALIDRFLAEGMSSNNLLDNRARALIQLNRHIEAISIWRKLSQSDLKTYNAILVKQLVGAMRLISRSQGRKAQCFNQDLGMLDALEGGVLKECDLLRGRGYGQLLI